MGSAGVVATAALAFAGYTSTTVAITESWNGTNWSEQNDLNTARVGAVSATAGSPTSNLAFGGEGPPQLGSTEEWVVGTGVTRTFTDS